MGRLFSRDSIILKLEKNSIEIIMEKSGFSMRYRNILGLFVGIAAGLMISDVDALASPAKEEPLAVLYSASDFQNMEGHAQGAEILNKITSQIYDSGNKEISEAFICGDYYYDDNISKEESEQGIKTVYEVLHEQWGLEYEDIYFVQGNHDPSDTVELDITGGTERDYYSVYQINYDDFMRNHQPGIDVETRIRDTSEKLKVWLEKKIELGDSNPIFIISHLPLHHSYRYDNPYAEYIFDVLNEASEQGLNIVYLFGHNHSSEYDKYLGGGAIYLTQGDEIIIPDIQGENAEDYKSEILNFTYMNAGYIGEATDGILSSCIFEIYDDRMVIKRYTEEGECYLKQSGNSSENDLGWEADILTRNSPQNIKLNRTIISWAEEIEDEQILMNPEKSKDLLVDIHGIDNISVKWECSNTEVLEVNADKNNFLKACINGKKYGTAKVTAIVQDLAVEKEIARLTIKVIVAPENAVCLSYGEHVRFYKNISDLNSELQNFMEDEKEYLITNSDKLGTTKVLAAQTDEYVGTVEARTIYVPGIGNVISENQEKNILWRFKTVEGISEDVLEYQIQLSPKSLYRYRYYLAVTYGVDSSLGHPNVTNMRTCSKDTSSGAAAFWIDGENANSLKTTHHFKDVWKENEYGTFSLIYDEDIQEFALSNQSDKAPISFYGRTQEMVSDIVMWTDAEAGEATIESAADELTGGVIYVMHGDQIEEIPITLEMLSGFDENVQGKYHCTVSFNGEVVGDNYELTLKNEGFDLIRILKQIVNLIFN